MRLQQHPSTHTLRAARREERIAGYAESALTSKRGDKAVEAATARVLAALFLTLGRDCAATFAALAEPLEVRPVVALWASGTAMQSFGHL